MSEEDQMLMDVIEEYLPKMSKALKEMASAAGHKDTGRLIRAMRTKVKLDYNKYPWGMATTMKRRGYILNYGVKAGTINRNGNSYYSKGIKGSRFIEKALDKFVPELAQALQKVSGDIVLKSMKLDGSK